MTDKATVRIVIAALALGVLFGLGSMAYLAFTQTAIPDQLDRLITFLAGALTSVLVRTGTDDAAPVEVVNDASDPVPVDPAPQGDTP